MEYENESVTSWIKDGKVKPSKASVRDLAQALDWIGEYETDDPEMAQRLANAMGFISNIIESKNRVQALNQAKREFAKANGLKFNQVRKIRA